MVGKMLKLQGCVREVAEGVQDSDIAGRFGLEHIHKRFVACARQKNLFSMSDISIAKMVASRFRMADLRPDMKLTANAAARSFIRCRFLTSCLGEPKTFGK